MRESSAFSSSSARQGPHQAAEDGHSSSLLNTSDGHLYQEHFKYSCAYILTGTDNIKVSFHLVRYEKDRRREHSSIALSEVSFEIF